MPEGRYVGGVLWEQDAARPPQTVLKLTHDEALTLHPVDRMSCLQKAVGPEVHLQLLDKAEQDPRILIVGRNAEAQKAVDTALGVVERLLRKDEGLAVAVHPHDISILRKQHCMLLAEVERESGCRIVAEDPPKETFKDPNISRHQQCIRLLGDQAAQARAVQMLTYHCMHPVLPLEPGVLFNTGQSTEHFDQVVRGANIELLENSTVARRVNCECVENPSDCVVGTGAMRVYDGGSFFCIGIRKLVKDHKIRGGTRLGVSCIKIAAPAPDSLVRKPLCSWVLGRGTVRGSGGEAEALPGANFDGLVAEGDTLGLLVTTDAKAEPSLPGPDTKGGSVRVFRRPRDSEDWNCLVHWDARVPQPHKCYGLVELSGDLLEIQLLQLPPPPANRIRGFPASEH